jgi:hypothetical protein
VIAPDVVPAPDPVERLQRYSRFVALVAEQLGAMREDDAERLRRLTEERHVLERELALAAAPETEETHEAATDGDAIDEGAALARLHDELGNALSELDERLDSERWKEEQWTLLSDGAIRSARSVPMVRLIGRAYPELQERTSHVDRRF